MDELRAHLKGMRHMIQLRGGYQNLGLEGLLSKMVIVYCSSSDKLPGSDSSIDENIVPTLALR